MGVWGVVRHRLRPPGPAHAPDSEAGRRLSCLEVVRVAGALLARQAGHGPQPADTQGPTLSPVAWEKGQEGLVQGAGREFRGPAFLPLPSPQLPVPPVIASTPISLSHTHTHARPCIHFNGLWCHLVLKPGLAPLVPVRASRAPSSGHWGSGHQAPPCFTEQIHFLHQAAALWNKRPYFLQPFLAEAEQPWKWLRDLALPRSQQVRDKPGPSLQAPSS